MRHGFLFLAAVAASGIVTASTAGEIQAAPKVQPAAIATAAPVRRADPADIVAIALDRLPPDALAKELAASRKTGVPLKVGFGRAVPGLQDEIATLGRLRWRRLDTGESLAALSITSPEAAAVRVGLRVRAIPAGARLRFYAPASGDTFEVTGRVVANTIAQNVKADGESEAARTYWSPAIEAQAIVVEVELPETARRSDLRIALPVLSHLVTNARLDWAMPKSAGTCNNDVTCFPAWGQESNAVARMLFSDGGSSFLCSGTLLADNDTNTLIPYFLSAAHCISTQSSASSLQTYWFYRSASCNSATTSPSATTLTGGADLLYAAPANNYTDTSFLRLHGTPPAGAVYAGWTASSSGLGASVTGIHHPSGDRQKISFGSVTGYEICTTPANDQFGCNGSSVNGATFYQVGWSSGVTEPGSSGSAIFDSAQHIVGQLYGGDDSCSNPGGSSYYGRFDVAFNASLKQWLDTKTLTVARAGSGAGTVTSSPAGISCGATCTAGYSTGALVSLSAAPAAGSVFTGWSGGGCSGTGSCSVTMNASTSITATFSATYTLSVAPFGAGSGIVTSAPGAIQCGAVCSDTFVDGTVVMLSAAANAGSVFAGWGQFCSGTGTCQVTMSQSKSVTAEFDPQQLPPGAPTIGTATPGNATAFIAFAPPASPGTAPISGYTATCNPGAIAASGTSSPIAVAGLANGIAYSCSVTAMSSAGTGAPSATVAVTPSANPAVALVAVKSRKVHGVAGTFDLAIDLSQSIAGSVSTEPRVIGAGHAIVFQFNAPISAPGNASVVDALGNPVSTFSTAFAGNEVVVTITGIADLQRITVSLANVNGVGLGASASLGFAIGDVNGTRSVSAADILAVKTHSGSTVDASNFQFDLNLSGGISAADILAVKARSGTVLP